MNKYILPIFFIGIIILAGCGGNKEPGRIYMPDMAYSRGVETYSEHDAVFTRDVNAVGGKLIFYNAMPPKGTMKRGELSPYTLPNDSNGYKMSAAIKNPFDSLAKADMAEAGRLYNINCAICHGATGAANGPLSTGGHIGGVANLTADAYVKMSDGTMFHSVTYGKGIMGSYASQLSRAQRWMIIKYIRTLQPKAGAAGAVAATDSTAKKM